MTHFLRTGTEHKTASLADEGNPTYCQSSGAHNLFLSFASIVLRRRDPCNVNNVQILCMQLDQVYGGFPRDRCTNHLSYLKRDLAEPSKSLFSYESGSWSLPSCFFFGAFRCRKIFVRHPDVQHSPKKF